MVINPNTIRSMEYQPDPITWGGGVMMRALFHGMAGGNHTEILHEIEYLGFHNYCAVF